VSKTPQNGSAQGAWTLPLDPHHEFESLCALSTTGELTAEEWARLTEHLAHCDACREAKRQYERVISTTMPALAVESACGTRGKERTWFMVDRRG
jgi:predicted anti-sigma-YlaC factor YlaD